jgi:hypothetical protein
MQAAVACRPAGCVWTAGHSWWQGDSLLDMGLITLIVTQQLHRRRQEWPYVHPSSTHPTQTNRHHPQLPPLYTLIYLSTM